MGDLPVFNVRVMRNNPTCEGGGSESIFAQFSAMAAPFQSPVTTEEAQASLPPYLVQRCVTAYLPNREEPFLFLSRTGLWQLSEECEDKIEEYLQVGRMIYLNATLFDDARSKYSSLSAGLIVLIVFLFFPFLGSILLTTRGKLWFLKLHTE